MLTFAYLFDTLMQLRRPFQREQNLSEEVTGWLLCVFVPLNLRNISVPWQEFRKGFYKVATRAILASGLFESRAGSAALTVSTPTSVVVDSIGVFSGRTANLGEWF